MNLSDKIRAGRPSLIPGERTAAECSLPCPCGAIRFGSAAPAGEDAAR